MKLSAKNILKGRVIELTLGAVNAEVVVELPGGDRITSMVTKKSVEDLELKVGKEAYAIIKASNVILGVD